MGLGASLSVTLPFKAAMARLALSWLLNLTKACPLLAPVCLSVIMKTSVSDPYTSNILRTCSSVVERDSMPTYSLCSAPDALDRCLLTTSVRLACGRVTFSLRASMAALASLSVENVTNAQPLWWPVMRSFMNWTSTIVPKGLNTSRKDPSVVSSGTWPTKSLQGWLAAASAAAAASASFACLAASAAACSSSRACTRRSTRDALRPVLSKPRA
mmetsp:Transcript_1829/g.2394  ORF Transcript_1829/g.2394 Transcript_1829/m.2394 type:complete len:214 (+) Transcript_1829:299-940(+)